MEEELLQFALEIIHAGGKLLCILCQRPGGNLQMEIVEEMSPDYNTFF